jgi:chromosomal replication initiator protein
MSYLTATKVAENPGTTFNPLYIFGGVGLGKTHLMQAIGNYIADGDVNNKILYVQANEYLEDYGRAIRDNNMKAFEEKYENLDVLLVDDIQMLEKGKSSQQEFFKLFNNMTDRQKQIVITSDTPPAKLNGIMERLTSRFQMGLTVDIKQPDYNQRVQILKRKLLETSQVQVSEDVIKYIAENFVNNVRELEGALTRVLWQAEILNTTPNIQIAKDTLEILINAQIKDDKTNYENALSVIADFYTISVADLLGKSRESKYTLPRHIAMYLLKNHYNLTYSKIGAIFNGRDHTTVMNGCTKIDGELNTDKELKMAVDSILKKI